MEFKSDCDSRSGAGKVFARWLAAASTLLLFCLVTVSGADAAAPSPDVQSPGAFPYVYESAIASGGGGIWLATTGQDSKDQFRSQILSFRNNHWRQLGGRAKTTSGYQINLVARRNANGKGSSPCYTAPTGKGDASIRCFEHGRWKTKTISKVLKGLTLSGLQANGRQITASFFGWQGTGSKTVSTIRVAKLVGNVLIPFGKPVVLKGQFWAHIVQSSKPTRTNKVQLAIRYANSGERWVETFGTKTLSEGPHLTDAVEGSFGSAPVKVGASTYFPVNQDYDIIGYHDRAASMSVFKLSAGAWAEVGGAPVSNDFGYAQGSVNAVGNRVWAVWQENDASEAGWGGFFPTKIFAARVSRDGVTFDKEIELWNGGTYFPGGVQAVEYKGGPVFLYNRQASKDAGNKATVDFSFVNSAK